MLEIGIVGYGVVGEATRKLLKEKCYIRIHDPEKGYAEDISQSDIVFICINEKDKSMKNLIILIDNLAIVNKKCLFVIRTTVIPGTTDRMSIRHKREFVFMPEFLREWNAEKDAITPDKIVIGTESQNTFRLLCLLFRDKIEPEKYLQVKPIEAELAKLALNSLALIKVVFAEELYDLSKALYAEYENIYKIFKLDQNINERHLKANDGGYRGADGKCLPKDTEFLISTGKDKSRMSLLETAAVLNDLYIEVKKDDRIQ